MKAFEPAVIRVGDGAERFHVLNISTAGALCYMTVPPPVGIAITIDFRFCEVAGRVVWTTDKRFGITFEQSIAPTLVQAILEGWGPRAV